MTRIAYFAYGSNMSGNRLTRRIPGAERLGVAQLADYRLAFHKRSFNDGSGKCDIVPSDGDTVYGVLFALDAADLVRLDRVEGTGAGYERKHITVRDLRGTSVAAETYRATAIDPALRPYTWYKRHVLTGAAEAGLPQAYVEQIEAIEAVRDPDRRRERSELAIYR